MEQLPSVPCQRQLHKDLHLLQVFKVQVSKTIMPGSITHICCFHILKKLLFTPLKVNILDSSLPPGSEINLFSSHNVKAASPL